DIRLQLVGDGEDRARWEEEVRRRRLESRVELTGYRTDTPAQLRRADAFVLPSVNENLPLALLEAMMAGLACVASRVGGVPEAIDERCGILVAPGDHGDLVTAMARLADEPELAARLGAAAAARARREFTMATC